MILAVIIIAIILAVWGFAYWGSEDNGNAAKISTKEQVAGLFSRKYNRPANNLQIEVTSDTGAFAKGTYNEPGSGGIWFAAKTANGWELASAGNGIAPCDEIEKYNFPKDMIPQCLDTQNGNKLIER